MLTSQTVWPDGNIIFQYLAIYIIEKVPNIKIYQSRFKFLPNTKSTLNYFKKINKIVLNCQNFPKSGHTGA